MSLHEYEQSRVIAIEDFPFYAIVMAAMRQADSFNAQQLAEAFPDTYDELQKRYNSPGGILEGER